MSTGPQFNTYEITDVSLGDTFQEWRRITNEDIIDKLNRIKLYTGISGDGISVGVNTAGEFQIEHSGHVLKGVTFGGEVTILGQMTTMHSTNVTVADYNLVLGGTYESGGTGCSGDSEILIAGGGGIIIARADGPSAGWLWKPHQIGTCGHTGAWTTNENIEFGDGKGLVTGTAGNIHFAGGESCESLIFGFTAAPGFTNSGGITRDHRSVTLRYDNTTLSTPVEIAEISEDGFANFHHGVNKKRVITASAHGLSFGMPVRPTANGFTAAYAANKEQAEAIGIVSDVINDTTFDITFQGEVRGDFSKIIDNVPVGFTLEIGKAYFLSSGNTGMLSQNAPVDSQVGFVRKPMMIGIEGDTGFVVSYIGGEIAESIETGVIAQGNRLLVNQENHGFTLGDVMRFDEGITNSAQPFGTYQKAQANTEVDAETQGIISGIIKNASGSSDAFYLTNSGWIDLADGPHTPYETGRVYFLTPNTSASTNSSLGLEYPRTINMVKKPMFIATSPTKGLVLSYVGRRITENVAPPTGGGDADETASLVGKTFLPTEGQRTTKVMLKEGTQTAPLPFRASGTNPSPYDSNITGYEKFRLFFSQSTESNDNAEEDNRVHYSYTNNTAAWTSISDYFTKITPPTNATHMMVKVNAKHRGLGRQEEIYCDVPNANFPNNFETTDNVSTMSVRGGVTDFNPVIGHNFTKIIPIENSNPNGQLAVSFGNPHNNASYTEVISLQVEVLGYFIEDGGLVVPPVVGRQGRNLIINSNFDHWQRGTAPTTLSTNFPADKSKYDTFHADRFHAEVIPNLTTAGSVSNIIGGMSQGTFSHSQTTVSGYPKHYLNFRGKIDANYGNNSTVSVGQRIDNVRRFANKDVTISYYAKGTVTGNVRLSVSQDYQALGNSADAHTIHVDDIAVSTGWSKFTHTVALPAFPSGITLGDSSFFDVRWTTFSSDSNGSFTDSNGATLAGFATGLTYDGILSLAQVQVEHGQQATTFQTPILDIDLEACQKYYQIAHGGWNGKVDSTASGSYGTYTSFPVPMRVNPICVKATDIMNTSFTTAVVEDMTNGYGGRQILTKRGFMPSRNYLGTPSTSLDNAFLAEYEFDAELKNDITK
jgi:hypothetical protein